MLLGHKQLYGFPRRKLWPFALRRVTVHVSRNHKLAIALISSSWVYTICNIFKVLHLLFNLFIIKIEFNLFCLLVCLFVMETSLLPVKGCKFWPMAIEQWRFFSMPHLLWHRSSVYNGHLRGPVTLTPIVESLAVELSIPVFTT